MFTTTRTTRSSVCICFIYPNCIETYKLSTYIIFTITFFASTTHGIVMATGLISNFPQDMH